MRREHEDNGSKDISATFSRPKRRMIGAHKASQVRANFAAAYWICVDEVSMLTASGNDLFGELNSRLKTAFRRTGCEDQPFGGKCVCLVGDFHQLQPVGGDSLAKILMMNHSAANALLFKQFEVHTLKQQMRQKNVEGNSLRIILEHIRGAVTGAYPPVNQTIIDQLKTFSHRDIDDDPLWRYAAILVADNAVRQYFNRAQALSFAKEHGKFVYTWRLPLTAAGETAMAQLPFRTQQQVYSLFPELTGYFVETAPAMCLFNLNPSCGIANGTLCTMHSMKFKPEHLKAVLDEIQSQQRDSAGAGSVILLPYAPQSINVTVPTLEKAEVTPGAPPAVCEPWQLRRDQWAESRTCVAGKRVFSIKTIAQKATSVYHKDAPWAFYESNVPLGFSFTVNKAQGQTFDRIYVSLSDSFISLQRLYVVLSRARTLSGIRILPGDINANTVKKMKLLAHPLWLQDYTAAVNEDVKGAFYCPVRLQEFADNRQDRIDLALQKSGKTKKVPAKRTGAGAQAGGMPAKAPQTKVKALAQPVPGRVRRQPAVPSNLLHAQLVLTGRSGAGTSRVRSCVALPPHAVAVRPGHNSERSGLLNAGNSCFLNAGMTALCAVDPWRHAIANTSVETWMPSNEHLLPSKPQDEHTQSKLKTALARVVAKTGVAVRALADVLHRLCTYDTDTTAIDCGDLINALQLHISDVHLRDRVVLYDRPFKDLRLKKQESIGDYLPRLLQLANFVGPHARRALIDATTVYMLTTTTCDVCHQCIATQNDWDRLPVQLLPMHCFPADSSFSTALNNFFFEMEIVHDYACDHFSHARDSTATKQRRTAQRTRTLHNFPEYLVVALQRTADNRRRAKDNRRIAFHEQGHVKLTATSGELTTYKIVATAVRTLALPYAYVLYLV